MLVPAPKQAQTLYSSGFEDMETLLEIEEIPTAVVAVVSSGDRSPSVKYRGPFERAFKVDIRKAYGWYPQASITQKESTYNPCRPR